MKGILIGILFLAAVVISIYPQSGIIREFTGDVQIKTATAADFTPARTGGSVSQDTVISTGFRSTAIIEIGGNTITVRPLTRLTLAEISASENTETVNVNLQTGRVRVEVNPPAGTRANTSVRGPNATASVRGTSFEMDTRNLTVTSGNVNWSTQSGFSSAVTRGFSSSIGVTGNIIDPVELSQSELTVTAPAGSGESNERTRINNRGSKIDVDIGIDFPTP